MNLRALLTTVLCGALLPTAITCSAQTTGAAQYGGAQAEMDGRGAQGDKAWDNDAFFYSIFKEPIFRAHGQGFRQGFRAGYEDGRTDIEDGTEAHFGYRFRYPDQYRVEFGSRDDYIREYQDGYKNGYKRGYAERA